MSGFKNISNFSIKYLVTSNKYRIQNNKPTFKVLFTSYFLLLTFLIITGITKLKAQDIHYTQFTIQPLQQSPAFTGDFDGNFRVAALYRNQWATVNVPYNTLGLSLDGKIYESKKFSSFLGLGSSFFFDQAGDGKLQSIYAQIPLSYTIYIPLSNDVTIKIGAGIYGGILRKSLNINHLQFDEQFTGEVFDPSLSNNENFGNLNFLKPDIGVGYNVAFNLNQKAEFGLAFGAHHLNKIEESFLDNSNSIQLQKRFAMPAYFRYNFSKKWEVQFDYIFQEQNAFQEHQFGIITSYFFKNDGPVKTALELGSYYRLEDAINLILRYRKNNFLTGISYDYNISDLRPATNAYGGVEFGFIYTIKKLKEPEIKNKRKCFVF